MFDQVWQWAGDYRTSDKNIGIPFYRMQPELRQTIDDARYQIDHNSYRPDEITVRFHHRLVWIHPFPSGNGNYRIAADALIIQIWPSTCHSVQAEAIFR